MEAGTRIVVGVNRFQQGEKRTAGTFRLDPALEQAQVDRLRQLRASRSRTQVAETLKNLEHAALGTSNLMPVIFAAADAYATVGEISDTLRRVFGEHRDAL